MAGDLTRFASFHDQFLLSPTRLEAPPGWRREASGGWHLISHPSLPVARLRTSDGAEAGFALGFLIDPEGRLAGDEIELPEGAEGDAARFEGFLYRYGGRFTTIVLARGLERVYVDPMATLTTVWCRQRRRIASTPTLLLHDEPDHPLFRRSPKEFPLNRRDQFFPADLTAAPGIFRIPPNHVLDLASWEASRHHPSSDWREATEDEIPDLVSQFHQIVRRQIGALIDACGGGYLALTAGWDSRRLLACARDRKERVECVTLGRRGVSRNPMAKIDLHVASRLAARFGLRHRILETRRVPRSVALDYVFRIGFAGGKGKVGKFFDPPARQLDLRQAWFTGHGGGLCTAKYVRRMPADEKPGARALLRLLYLPAREGFVEAMDRWSAGLPEVSKELRLDLAILEHQGGGWVSPHFYGSAPFRAKVLPIAHREAIDAVLRVPAAYRASGGFDERLFRLAWPELLDLPFNRGTGARHWIAAMRELLARRARILRSRSSLARWLLSRRGHVIRRRARRRSR